MHQGSRESTVASLPIGAIEVNPRQPRVHFDPAPLEELAESIRERGILQPVLVRSLGEGRFELIAGERRLRAARLAGLAEIPALVRSADESESLLMAVIENIQRSDLNPLEEARAYHALMQDFSLTQEDVAQRVGKSRPTIANALRLLQLPGRVQEDLRAGRITASHARALLGMKGLEESAALSREITDRKLSVRRTEKAARDARRGSIPSDPDVSRMESDLSRSLGTKVRIHAYRADGKGHVEIAFYSHDDLARLAGLLQSASRASGSRASLS